MKKLWKSRIMASAIAAVTAAGLLSGSSAMVLAEPAKAVISPEEETEITATETETIDPADENDEEVQEAAAGFEESEAEGELPEVDSAFITSPLDFDTDPSSREGDCWKWDKDTGTLTLSGIYMDLTDYDQDYTAAILLPDLGDIPVTVDVSVVNPNNINISGVNKDGERRIAIYCKGALVIKGSGTLKLDASGGAAGIKADGPVTIGEDGGDPSQFGIRLNATDYAFSSDKNLTVFGQMPLELTVSGADEASANAALYAANTDAADIAIDIHDAYIHVIAEGSEPVGILACEGEISIDNTEYKQFFNEGTGVSTSGIVNRNGGISINGNSNVNITLSDGEEEHGVLIAADENGQNPSVTHFIQIADSSVTGVSYNKGLSSPCGGIGIESSVINVTAVEKALEAGSAGLSVVGSQVSAKNTGGLRSDAVSSEGPVTINDSQVYFEADGEKACALSVEDEVMLYGEMTYVDLKGQMAAIEINTTTDVTDMPLSFNDGLAVAKGGTGQYVDNTAVSPAVRIFSYSESTLGIDDGDLKDASTEVIICNSSTLAITDQPEDAIVSYPDGATFEVKVNNESKVDSYQWYCENDAGQEFKLDGPTSDKAKLEIPSTSQHSTTYYYSCRITDTDGNVLESRRAVLDLDNRDENKTVVYVGWNAIEPGESLDLKKAGLGSGTIVFDSDGTTITFDNVHYNNTKAIWDDHLIPSIGITVNRHMPEDPEYKLIVKGDCSIKNTFIQDKTNLSGMSLDFLFYGDGANLPVVHVSEDPSGGSLTITGGTTAFRVLGDLDLSTDVTVKPGRSLYMDGIDANGFTLASGHKLDLTVSGYGVAMEGEGSIGGNSKVKIDMTPAGAILAAVYSSGGTLEIGDGAIVDIYCHATPNTGVTIQSLCGFRLEGNTDMQAKDAEITIRMSAKKGEEGYATNFIGVSGLDGSDFTFDNTTLYITVNSDSIIGASGIYTMGKANMNNCEAVVRVRAAGMVNGIAPEHDLKISDSVVDVTTKAVPYSGMTINYGIAASSVNIDLENAGCYVKACTNNDDGIAMLAKTGGSGKKQKGYDPSYVGTRIKLDGFASCLVPENNTRNLTSIPGTMHPYVYCETYYDTTDTTKPVSKVEIVTAKDISGATVTPAKTKYTYNGSAIKPAVTVKLGKTTLKQDRDYTVKYSRNKNVGTATITVTGKGNYTGTAKGQFKIVPAGTSLTEVTGASKAFTAKWKKQTRQTTGYQIQYSQDKNFKSGNKSKTISTNTTTSKKVTGLQSKKTYYVRVRTFKLVDGKRYYSAWSSRKSVKTK